MIDVRETFSCLLSLRHAGGRARLYVVHGETAFAARPEAMQLLVWKYVFVLCFVFTSVQGSYSDTKFYEFNITSKRITRLCSRKTIVTVNNKFPGPTIHVNEGDRLVIKVNNQVSNNITLHWHGIFQNRTGWFDGPSHVTQCPLQTGNSFTYNFTITGQRGTLWWHAHITWLRATVYGALIVHPQKGARFPFLKPKQKSPIEKTLILGEWWKSDVLDVINEALRTGGGTNSSDALTINGKPGPLYQNCSVKHTYTLNVHPNHIYLLRVINAAMNAELFFAVANHTFTVVEADASYVQPFQTSAIMIAPGQTISALIITNQAIGSYYMATNVFVSTPPGIPFDDTIGAAILRYRNSTASSTPILPSLPAFNDSQFASDFEDNLRSTQTVRDEFPIPENIKEDLFFTVGLNNQDCPPGASNITCQGLGGRFAASINNMSYVAPPTAFLESHFNEVHFNTKSEDFTYDFPIIPPFQFNYTGIPLRNQHALKTTRVHRIAYGCQVQIVLQGSTLLIPENHPIHLHGFDFYVIANGLGNFDASTDMSKFNLVDPPVRNTIGVPAGGWTVIRFIANNPGTWILHCHLDLHSTLGLGMVFVVDDGQGPLQTLEPPPKDLPAC